MVESVLVNGVMFTILRRQSIASEGCYVEPTYEVDFPGIRSVYPTKFAPKEIRV